MFPIIKFIGFFNKKRDLNFSFYVSLFSIIIGLFSLNALDTFSLGFKNKIQSKLSYLDGHIKIKKIDSLITYNEFIDISNRINKNYKVYPYIKKNIILRNNKNIENIILIALPPDYFDMSPEISFNKKTINNESIMLSETLIRKNNLKLDSHCYIYNLDVKTFEELKPKKIKISGTFTSDFKEYDNRVAFTEIKNIENQNYSGLIINTDNYKDVDDDISEISKVLNDANFQYISWYSQHRSFIDWLDLFHIPIKIIIFLITLVSSFSISSSLYLFIDEKKYHVSLLRSIGYTSKKIRNIFFRVVLILSTFGILVANSLTIALYFFQDKYELIKLQSDVYFMNSLPVYFSFESYIQNSILILSLICIFSIYPILGTEKNIPKNLRKHELI